MYVSGEAREIWLKSAIQIILNTFTTDNRRNPKIDRAKTELISMISTESEFWMSTSEIQKVSESFVTKIWLLCNFCNLYALSFDEKKISIQSRFSLKFKVHIFWEGHKILRNFHQLFDWQIGQIIGGDFAKFCGLLRIYEL